MTYFLLSWARKAWVWLVAAIGLLVGVITDRWEIDGKARERER